MGKFVKGSYTTIEEANTAVEELIAQGYDRTLLTLVTNKETYDKHADAANTAVNADHADDDKSAWDKVKDVFSDAPNTDEGYQADEEVLAPYQEDIDDGKIVLLVDDFSSEAGATDFTNSTPPDTNDADEHVVAKPDDTDKPTSIPPVLDHEDDMDSRRRNSHYTPNPNPGNSRTPRITEDMATGDDTDYDYQDEVDHSVDTNLLADTEENMLPDETVDPDMQEGSLGSAASDEATGLDNPAGPLDGTRPGTRDTSGNPGIPDNDALNDYTDPDDLYRK